MSENRFRKEYSEMLGGSSPFPAWEVNPVPHELINEEQTVWRYTTVPQLINSLRKSDAAGHISLHFTRTSWFDDEDDFEGTVPKKNIQNKMENLENFQRSNSELDVEKHLENQYGGQLPDTEDVDKKGAMEKLRDLVYLNCWTAKSLESNPMWYAYTNDSTGVAIKSTVGSLVDSISDWGGKLFYGQVRYIDFEEAQFPLSPIQHYFLKRREFVEEQEFRLAMTFKQTPAMLNPTDTESMRSPPDDDYLDVTAGLNSLASEIIVHPQSDPYLKPMLEDVLEKYQIDSELVSHSSLRPR